MLPNSQHSPAFFSQLDIHLQITFPISLHFGVPVALVRQGTAVPTRAAVPETAINKDRKLFPVKYEIGRARKTTHICSPSTDPCPQ